MMLADKLRQRLHVAADIQKINHDLADNTRRKGYADPKQYNSWRVRALNARRRLLVKLGDLDALLVPELLKCVGQLHELAVEFEPEELTKEEERLIATVGRVLTVAAAPGRAS